MSFQFRYKALLAYRGHLKEKAEVELARTQRRLNQAREMLKHSMDRFDQGRCELERSLSQSLSSDDLQIHLDYLSGLKIRIEIENQEVQRWKEKAKRKMEIFLEKTKEYKAMEKLKEKDFGKWNYQQLQEEQKTTNETAVLRFNREVHP